MIKYFIIPLSVIDKTDKKINKDTEDLNNIISNLT